MESLGFLSLTASGLRGGQKEAEDRGGFSSTLWMEAQGMDDTEELWNLLLMGVCLSVSLSICLSTCSISFILVVAHPFPFLLSSFMLSLVSVDSPP